MKTPKEYLEHLDAKPKFNDGEMELMYSFAEAYAVYYFTEIIKRTETHQALINKSLGL